MFAHILTLNGGNMLIIKLDKDFFHSLLSFKTMHSILKSDNIFQNCLNISKDI